MKEKHEGDGLCGELIFGGEKGGGRAREMSVRDTLEGLGFPDGGTEGDAVVVVEGREGGGRSGEVIEGAIVGGEVHNEFGDGDIVIAVIAGFVKEGADIGYGAGDGLSGRDGEGARGDIGTGGGFGILEGTDLGIIGGKDGIGERAKGAVGGVAGLDGIEAVVCEGGVLLGIFGFPKGDDFFGGKEGGIVAVSFGGVNGVRSFPRGKDGFHGRGSRLVKEGGGGIKEGIILLVPLEETSGAEGDHGDKGGEAIAEGIVLPSAKFLIFGVREGKEGVAVGFKESGGINAEVFLGTGRANLEDLVGASVAEEEIGLAVRAGSMAVVAVVGAEIVHEEVGIGFIVAENLLYAVLKGDSAKVTVVHIVLFDDGKAGAMDIADLNVAGLGSIVGIGIALEVVGEFNGDDAGLGEGVGNRGLAMLVENAVKVLHLLDEEFLAGDPDGLGEVRQIEGVGEGSGF